MSVLEKFRELNGKTISRKQIENLIVDAKNENETEVVYRLSKILLNNPDTQNFDITLNRYATSLNAPRHKGLYKEALTECGRLRKGWRFERGSVIKVPILNKKTKQYKMALNGGKKRKTRQSEMSLRELDDFLKSVGFKSSGKLKKGYKYVKGGEIVKVPVKKKGKRK